MQWKEKIAKIFAPQAMSLTLTICVGITYSERGRLAMPLFQFVIAHVLLNTIDTIRTMFEWIKKIFGKESSNPIGRGFEQDSSIRSQIDLLNNRRITVLNQKNKLKTSSTEWFHLNIHSEKRKQVLVFKSLEIHNTPTLKTLKEERQQKERDRLLKLENSVKSDITILNKFISEEDVFNADKTVSLIALSIQEVTKKCLWSDYEKSKNQLAYLKDVILQRELSRKAEEQRRKNNADRIRKEELFKQEQKLADEKRKEQQEREVKVKQYQEELRKKEKSEQDEKQRLLALSLEKKDRSQDFEQILKNNGVRCFYHFTDKRNIISIKKVGGLLSWHYCKSNNIQIPYQGGDVDSENLDKLHGLEDFVRLSFCDDHPMAWRLKKGGYELVLLKVEIDVAWMKDTLFSNMNATDNLHSHGGEISDLQKIKFNATKRHYVSRSDDDFKYHQAEVMVKTFIPVKYIMNIDNPIQIT